MATVDAEGWGAGTFRQRRISNGGAGYSRRASIRQYLNPRGPRLPGAAISMAVAMKKVFLHLRKKKLLFLQPVVFSIIIQREAEMGGENHEDRQILEFLIKLKRDSKILYTN